MQPARRICPTPCATLAEAVLQTSGTPFGTFRATFGLYNINRENQQALGIKLIN